MLTIDKEMVTFSRDTWEELKKDVSFNELIEAIQGREELQNAIEETTEIIDFRKFDINHRTKLNV